MAELLWVREIDDDKGRRLVRIIRPRSGPTVIWCQVQIVLLSAQARGVPRSKVAFTSGSVM